MKKKKMAPNLVAQVNIPDISQVQNITSVIFQNKQNA